MLESTIIVRLTKDCCTSGSSGLRGPQPGQTTAAPNTDSNLLNKSSASHSSKRANEPRADTPNMPLHVYPKSPGQVPVPAHQHSPSPPAPKSAGGERKQQARHLVSDHRRRPAERMGRCAPDNGRSWVATGVACYNIRLDIVLLGEVYVMG